jgi:hypothetical protein
MGRDAFDQAGGEVKLTTLTAPSGFARSIRSRSRGLFIASHRSLRRYGTVPQPPTLPRLRGRAGWGPRF